MNNFFQKIRSLYKFWPGDVFIIPPSSGALALHALIISLEPSGKIVKVQNDCAKISEVEFFDTKLFKTSFNFDLKTSCALPPYYSLELDPISSTSHSNSSRGPASRFTWFAASAKRKFIYKVENLMNSDILACFSRFYHFLNSGWFWDGFTMNFESLARFAAREWFRIAPGFKFHSK